ncbi:MAG: DUF3298 domain-containing protein [Bacteroidota bacterium]
MIKQALLPILAACLLAACGTEPQTNEASEPSTDSTAIAAAPEKSGLQIEMKTIQRASKECQSPDNPCARFQLTYPEIVGHSGPLSDSLRRFVFRDVFHSTDPEGRYPSGEVSLDKIAETFITAFEEMVKAEGPPATGSEFNVQGEVLYENSKILTIALPTYSYSSGAAHPNYFTSIANFDKASGRQLRYEDLLTDRKKTEEIVQQYFLKSMEEKTGEPMKIEDFFWGSPFTLSENFAIEGDSIQFLYNPYEAAAYVFGETSIKLPIEQFEGLIRSEQFED